VNYYSSFESSCDTKPLEPYRRVDPFDALLKDAAHVPSISIPASRHYVPQIGRFEIVKRLGEGGMGVVYEAIDQENQSRVALKSLSRLDPSGIYRIKREFRALAHIAHPNLVGLHELFSSNGQWFFTMDLVEGNDFCQYVRSYIEQQDSVFNGFKNIEPTGVDYQRIYNALSQLLQGIAAIHSINKLHRDLKPSNVLVTQEGRVVILDFGLVTDQNVDDRRHPTDENLTGTPAYMSPEQAALKGAVPASDFYAVGVMLYEVLVGRLPFQGPPLYILQNKQIEDPIRPSALVSGIPAALDELCMSLLRRDPNQRPRYHEILARLGNRTVRTRPPSLSTASVATRNKLVGRQTQIEALKGAFEEVKQGKPKVVFIQGSSGMGKTALAHHFIDELKQRNTLVFASRCYEREAVPFKAFDGIIDELSRYLRQLPVRQALHLMPRDVHSLARIFPVLNRVRIVAESSGRTCDTSDPEVLQSRAFGALKELLLRITDRQPLVLFIDDLHWSDLDSADLLEEIFSPPDSPALLLIGCFRQEEVKTSNFLLKALRPPDTSYLGKQSSQMTKGQLVAIGAYSERFLSLSSMRSFFNTDLARSQKTVARRPTLRNTIDIETLMVEPLCTNDARIMAMTLLNPKESRNPGLVSSIARESNGVPFYVSELVQYINTGYPSDDLKASNPQNLLHQLLSKRFSSLSEKSLRLLRVISIAGRPIAQSLALKAAGIHTSSRNAIQELRSAKLIHTRGSSLSEPVTVYHDRIREIVICSITSERLQFYHARLAITLEESGIASADWLAEHLRGAGMSNQAAEYAIVAANRANRALAFGRASELYGWGLALFQFAEADFVRRGVVIGSLIGAFLGFVFSILMVCLMTDFSEEYISSTLLAGLLGGSVIGMVLGSVVFLLSSPDPEKKAKGKSESN